MGKEAGHGQIIPCKIRKHVKWKKKQESMEVTAERQISVQYKANCLDACPCSPKWYKLPQEVDNSHHWKSLNYCKLGFKHQMAPVKDF